MTPRNRKGEDTLTNAIAITLVLLIAGLFALDAALLHWNLPVVLGRQFVGLVEWTSFWR